MDVIRIMQHSSNFFRSYTSNITDSWITPWGISSSQRKKFGLKNKEGQVTLTVKVKIAVSVTYFICSQYKHAAHSCTNWKVRKIPHRELLWVYRAQDKDLYHLSRHTLPYTAQSYWTSASGCSCFYKSIKKFLW